MERKTYRWCVVPECRNTSIATPNKLFIDVPRKADARKKWLKLARRQDDAISSNSPVYFCEDHFDLPNDMENYMRYHVMGYVKKIVMKPGCVPSKFYCQADRKRSIPSTSTPRPAVVKRQRLALIQEALEDNKLESTKEITTLSHDIQTDFVRVEPVPKTQDKGVQVIFKSKYFRSKYTQTDYHSKNTATSPSKIWSSTISTSPFKVEQLMGASMSNISKINRKFKDGSDSNMSSYATSTLFQASSFSIQPLQSNISSDSSSLNEDEIRIRKQRETQQALNNMKIKIEAKPRFYIGLNKDCYFLVDLISKNTNILTDHILLCLKKIRLNTTFSELADQFGISETYAGKIFLKNVPIIASNLKPFIVKLDTKYIKRCLPISFKHRYNKVSCIIDCFEIEIEKPAKSLNQALTWSEYKKGNTIKYLISSTPNGLVNYISPGYGGRISDTLLLETCGFSGQLEPGSWVLADRGFKHIEQVLIQKQCYLLRPPSVTKGVKLDKQDALKTKQIASLRIHIERVILRIREFSMLKPHSVLNSNLIRVLDDCVLIACAFINLQDSIVQ